MRAVSPGDVLRELMRVPREYRVPSGR
jgi:hypothetical protein